MSTFSVVVFPAHQVWLKVSVLFAPSTCTHSIPEGVLVAKKDPNLPKHNEIDTKNLYVRSTVPDTFAPV